MVVVKRDDGGHDIFCFEEVQKILPSRSFEFSTLQFGF